MVRIHTGNPPASTVQQQLQRPHWMKNPSPSSSVGGGIVLNATVGRSACRYTRIAHLYPHGHQQLGRRPSNFRLTQHSSSSGGADEQQQNLALAITADEGIVYVSQPQLLSKSSNNWLLLKVSWDVGVAEGSTTSGDVTTSCLIRVDFIDDSTKRSLTECHENLLCAGFHNEQDCHEAQGSVATDQRGCSWRSHGHRDNSSSVAVSSLSRQYQTCSPDLSTCPDGYCDDLESQSWEICPQDCTGI